MLDKQALAAVPNCLGRRPSCWKCGQTSHPASSSPENKASGITASVNPPLPATNCCAASTKCMPAATSPVKPSTLTSAVVERAEGEWLVAGRGRGKVQTARPLSHEYYTAKDTKSLESKISRKGDTSATYAQMSQQVDERFESSYEKKEKLIQLKEKLWEKSSKTTYPLSRLPPLGKYFQFPTVHEVPHAITREIVHHKKGFQPF